MAYQMGWSENHPGHLVYVLDISGSMQDDKKIDRLITAVEDVVKDLIQEAAPSGIIEDNLTLTIIAYHNKIKKIVDNKTLSEIYQQLVKGQKLLDKETNAKPEGLTCTADAMREAIKDINAWIGSNKNRPAPMVIHVTDGCPYEGSGRDEDSFVNAMAAVNELKAIATNDGNTRLFNIHIEPSKAAFSFPTTCPNPDRDIDKKIIRFLYDSASDVDEGARMNAELYLGPNAVKPGSKFMISNVSSQQILTKLIRWGSTPSQSANRFRETPV